MNEFVLLATVALISGVLQVSKAYHKRDLGLLSTSLTRIYLFVITLLFIFNFSLRIEIYWAVIAVLVGDIINAILYLATVHFKEETEKAALKRQLEDVNSKLFAVMDSSTVCLFSMRLDGDLEYANDVFTKEFNVAKNKVKGLNLFTLFEVDRLEFYNGLCALIDYEDKKYTIRGFRTKNGHDTITGSIS